MTQKQRELLLDKFVNDIQRNRKKKKALTNNSDLDFIRAFFEEEKIDEEEIRRLLIEAISDNCEEDFDLLLSLLEHFNLVRNYTLILAPLLIQPWHHFHDRIAAILEFNVDSRIVDFLFKGALYRCENLEYESDYCEFNRKCLFALAKIGTIEAINRIKEVEKLGNSIVAGYAHSILVIYKFIPE